MPTGLTQEQPDEYGASTLWASAHRSLLVRLSLRARVYARGQEIRRSRVQRVISALQLPGEEAQKLLELVVEVLQADAFHILDDDAPGGQAAQDGPAADEGKRSPLLRTPGSQDTPVLGTGVIQREPTDARPSAVATDRTDGAAEGNQDPLRPESLGPQLTLREFTSEVPQLADSERVLLIVYWADVVSPAAAFDERDIRQALSEVWDLVGSTFGPLTKASSNGWIAFDRASGTWRATTLGRNLVRSFLSASGPADRRSPPRTDDAPAQVTAVRPPQVPSSERRPEADRSRTQLRQLKAP